jgi:hypothetical protein
MRAMTRHLTVSLLSVLLLAAIGCGGGHKSAKTTPPTTDTTKPTTGTTGTTTGTDDPTRKLTQDECTKAVGHALELLKADPNMKDVAANLDQTKDEAVKQCVADGTKKDYDCVMASKVATDLGNCQPPAKNDEGETPTEAPAQPSAN